MAASALFTIIALAATLSFAETTWSENLVLADCGIGKGVNGGSTSRQMMYYSGAAWGTPNWMAEVPWDGSYPWRNGGVERTLPNGDRWFVAIKNDAGDPNLAGFATHSYDAVTLTCWSRHIDGLYTLDDGTMCSMAYICNHAKADEPPKPVDPPKPDTPKFTFNVGGEPVQLVGYKSPADVLDLVEWTGTGAEYCAEKTYTILGSAKFNEPEMPDCTVRFACGPKDAKLMREIARNIALQESAIWAHSRQTLPNCKKTVVCLNPQACTTTCHQNADCTCGNQPVERLITDVPSHVVIDKIGDAQSRFEYWIDCPQTTHNCEMCNVAKASTWGLDLATWGLGYVLINGACLMDGC